jgi:D-alanyl-D-alanine carboxypeptidase (penicillin-binding protein 5/6)
LSFIREYDTIFTYIRQGVFALKKIRYTALVCAFIIVLTFAFSSCAGVRPYAVLHDDFDIYAIAYSDRLCKINIKSPQGFVYDVQNDCFVFSKGKDKVVYPGSTSKLITILYALSVLPPEKVITAGDELDFVKAGSSIAYIKKGHSLTVEMLVEGMLLPSGNDAAYVLAAAVGREIEGNDITAEEALFAFTEGVNNYTKTLGLCGTFLTVPDGYAGEEHYTTTEDIAIVARAAMENPIIAKYAKLCSADVRYASGEINTWVNTNKLLNKESKYYSPYATGLKTGSISGEYSLLFAFRFDDGREYIAGVFGADNKNERFEDANTIINYFEDVVDT